MFKIFSTVTLSLFTLLVYGQNITFQPNVNHKANELEQILDEHKNLLVLESKTKEIQRVDIFNDEFSESINVNSNKMNIDLNTLPIGNFVVKAKLDKKWIVMSLEKKEHIRITSFDQRKKDTNFKSNNITKTKNQHYYWVVSESNSSFGSSKIMKLEYKENLDELISKIKLELKSVTGKNNKLILYEIYNKSQFMTNQLRNSEYYKSKSSTVFNVVPVYAFMNREVN